MDDQARGLLDVAEGLVGELDLEVVIERLLASARELTDARYAALGVLNSAQTELERFVTAGIGDAACAHIGELPRGRGVLGELILDPVALRLAEVGDHPRSYGFPLGHPAMGSFLGVPLFADGVLFGSLYLTEKADGAQFTDADEQSATTLARFAGVAIDHARRYTGATAHRDELARRVAAFEATAQITRAVAGATDIEVILGLVAKRGRALVAARTVLIELVDGGELVVAAAAGAVPAGVVGARIAVADTVASAALRTRTTQRLEVELNRARFAQHDVGRLGVSADAGLVVPLIVRDQTYGVVTAVERLRDGPAFSAEDQRLLEAFATSAATAVATAQTATAELGRQRLAATEDERRRWARELHDETLQSLAGLRIGLSTAHRTGDPEALKDAVGEAIIALEEGISNLRTLVSDLRPGALDDLGLGAAVHGLCDRAGRHGLQIDCALDLAYEQGRAPARHSAELETTIYRISQEALTNAAKHGHAQRVAVEITESQTTVKLTVRDDGAGFDPVASTAGFGLLGMRERVRLLGGTVRVQSAVGDGTRVTARFPVQRSPTSRGAVNEAVTRGNVARRSRASLPATGARRHHAVLS
jgi:signal transduction histidine kinase